MKPRRDAAKGISNTPDSLAIGRTLYGLFAAAVRRLPREMSLTALSTLSTLDRFGPRRITDLAAVEGVTQPSMTTLVSALERSGFVERLTDPTDKRVVLVAITSSGTRYRRARRQAGAEAFALLIDKLPLHERKALVGASTALERLLELDEEDRNTTTGPVDGRSDGGVS
jgi:DNA-binding MarR family transcriptional regulator